MILNSVEELDALPLGAVIVDYARDAHQKCWGYYGQAWVAADFETDELTSQELLEYSPLTLAWVPPNG